MKKQKGFTLVELIVSLGLWMILSLGVLFLWQHATHRSADVMQRQWALEQARGSMDILLMNIQLAHTIRLDTNNNGIMRRLTLTQYDPNGRLHDYVFEFNINLPETAASYQRLLHGGAEVASGIARIEIVYVLGRRMEIMIQTACEEPIVLRGSVDVRYKNVIRL